MKNHVFRQFARVIIAVLILSILAGYPTSAVPASLAAGPTSTPVLPDLSGVQPKPIDDTITAQLDAYIVDAMQRTKTPGVAVAIVQNGKVVYAKGFGVRELGKPDPVTPDTLMMIGSTGKSMTTMMMATLVDEGRMTWDTPAVKIYPAFAVSDPTLTPKITLRNLVCNCTGIQRHDIELAFTVGGLTADDIVHSLRTLPFSGEFGKTFGYINQVVATGGYLAAQTAPDATGKLYSDYLAQMQRRIFDPIGMSHTTFSFDQVAADPDHAIPHGLNLDGKYIPLALDQEKLLVPVAPAGASWSNVQDMARYLITQLNRGVAPSGDRVVSAEALQVTWQPGVEIAPGVYYGLGWGIGSYKGARLLDHTGGTTGFSSDMSFLPDANLGVVVLTNAGVSEAAVRLPSAVRTRLLELAFGQPMEADARLDAAIAADQKTVSDAQASLQSDPDPAVLAPYLETYTNEALGKVTLTLKDGKFVLDGGEIVSQLRRVGDKTYVLWDPLPVGHLQVKLDQDATGRPTWQLISLDPEELGTYAFTLLQPSP